MESNVGTASGYLSNVQQAKDYHVRALDIRLKNLGHEHIDVAASYTDLGRVCSALGECQQAKEYHSRALNIRLKSLGPEHDLVADSYSALGKVYGALGEYDQKKDYSHRALDIRLKNLGPKHYLVAASYSDLGKVYGALGKPQQAREYHALALDIRLKSEETMNFDVAASYTDLGCACSALGECQQAKEYHSHALNIRLKSLGPEHDLVADSYSALGKVYGALGEDQQEKDYCHRALDIRLKNLGPEHYLVAASYSDLGKVYGTLGEPQKAKKYHTLALDIRLKSEETMNFDVAASYTDLGRACSALGECEQAKQCHSHALNIRLKSLGPEHDLVADSYSALGKVYGALGEYDQNKDYCHRALDIRLKNLGPKHYLVAASYSDLGKVYGALGEPQQAKKYHVLALYIRLKSEETMNFDVAASYTDLGRVCSALGECQQAKGYHSHALNICLKIFGPEHDLVADSYSALGKVYGALGEYDLKKDYCHRALDIRLKNLGPKHYLVAASYSDLGKVYGALGELQQAKEYHALALDIRLKSLEPINVDVADHYSDLGSVCSALDECKQAKERADVSSLSKSQTVHSVPPSIMARGSIAKAAYQRALETGKAFDKRVKILLIGQDRVGKTSVARSLKGELFRQDESSTVGVQIDMPLKHVGEKPWTNSKEEQEKSIFHYKCALNISKQLQRSEVAKQTETDETQRTEGVVGEKGSNQEFFNEVRPKSLPKGKQDHDIEKIDKIYPITQGDNGHNEKRNNDMPDEVVRLTTENLSRIESVKDDGIWPVCMDFGGQAIYRAIHPILASREAVYLLVVDPTKDLSAPAQCLVKEPGYDEVKIPSPDNNDTNLDHIMRWLDMVNSFKHEKNGDVLPPVILVGTRADLVKGDPEIVTTSVKDIICDTAREFSEHIIGKTFAVNNTLAGKELEEEDPQVFALRKEILKVADTLPHTQDEVPLRWLQVENEVCYLASRGTNYVTRQDFRKNICDEICKFEVEGDYEVLLEFLHDRGSVVYHGRADDPGSLVFLNPKWLIDVLCQIITVEKQKEEKTVISNLRKDLGKYGILDAKLLDYSCTKLGVGGIKESLLFLMKQFNLLCEYTGKDGGSVYLVPCMLTSPPDDVAMPGVSADPGPAPVYVTFSTQYVPGGLFSRMVVLFLEFVQRRITCDQPKLWANFARLFVGYHTAVDFVCYKRVIKVRVWNPIAPSMNPVVTEPNDCREVLSFLKTSLERLHKECHWLQTVSWDLCARCNLCPRQFVRETGKCYWHAEVECCHDDCAHYVSLTRKPFVCSRTLRGPEFCPPETWSQVLDDANGKNLSGQSSQSFPQTKGVSSLAQCSSVHFGKRYLPHQTAQSVVPAKVVRTDFDRPETNQGGETFIPEEVFLEGKKLKEGTLSSDDHDGLSYSISKDWRKLGRRLGILNEDLENIDETRREFSDKADQMLQLWEQRNASNATYRVLCQALCHKFLNRRDLAERFCFH